MLELPRIAVCVWYTSHDSLTPILNLTHWLQIASIHYQSAAFRHFIQAAPLARKGGHAHRHTNAGTLTRYFSPFLAPPSAAKGSKECLQCNLANVANLFKSILRFLIEFVCLPTQSV